MNRLLAILMSTTEFVADSVGGSTTTTTTTTSTGGGFTEWSAWGIVVLLMMAILLYEGQRKAREKEFIKGYKNFNDGFALTHRRNRKTGLKIFGEFLGEFYNETARCYEMRFRSGISKYFNVYSNDPMAEYKEVHFLERNYWIYYSINAQLYKKALKESEYYTRKLGYTLQAYIYKAICFCINLSTSGIVLSLIIFGSLFAVVFSDIKGLSFMMGCGFGLVLCIINYTILNYTTQAKNLLKLKEEIVKEEFYLSALESPEKEVNVYKVWGEERVEKITSDEAKTLGKKKLTGIEKINYVDDVKESEPKIVVKNAKAKKQQPKKKENKKKKITVDQLKRHKSFEIVKLTEDETVDYVIVRTYDKLFEMIQNPHVTVEQYELIGKEKMRKTRQEIRDLRHGYLERNKLFAETIFRLQRENSRVQDEYLSVREQLHSVEERKDLEVRKLGIRMLKTQEKTRKTVRNIFEELAGDIVGKEWDQKLEQVLLRVELEKQATQANRMSSLITAIEQLIGMVGQKSNINMSDILERLDLSPKVEEVDSIV